MGLYHFPGLLARQDQLPPDSVFLSKESQIRKQVSAMSLHTQCGTCIALLIPTARLENKVWKTFIDCNVFSTLIHRFPIDIWTSPKDTHPRFGMLSLREAQAEMTAWHHYPQYILTPPLHASATAASFQKKDATEAGGKAHRTETMATASLAQGRRPLKI